MGGKRARTFVPRSCRSPTLARQFAMLTITADSNPDPDAVLAADLAYHLGERDAYDVDALETACGSHAAPDDAFVAFHLGHCEFIAGDYYKENCIITDAGIQIKDASGSSKQRRTIATINRDISLMDGSVPYACDYRDARDYDYAAIFQTERPIPVFQYHRRKGRTAIIHPLRHIQEIPSPKIPSFVDTTAFRDKAPKIFWRGNLSGRVRTNNGVVGTPVVANNKRLTPAERLKLLLQCSRLSVCSENLDNPDIDAGLVMHWGRGAYKQPLDFLVPYCRPGATPEQQCVHRYLLALDGYDAPSSWFWLTRTHSLVFRDISPWETFGDCFFQPWVHYVPVEPTRKDLMEKFEWCERNVPKCEAMVANANKAWSVLFDADYQVARRAAVLDRYRDWFLL